MRQNFLQIARETNLILSAREARATPQKPWRFLQIAAQKTAKISESLILVGIYDQARTFFQENFWKEFPPRPASARKLWRSLRPKTEKFSLHFFWCRAPKFFSKRKRKFSVLDFCESKKAEAEHFKVFSFYTFGRHRPTQPNAGDSMEFPVFAEKLRICYIYGVKTTI